MIGLHSNDQAESCCEAIPWPMGEVIAVGFFGSCQASKRCGAEREKKKSKQSQVVRRFRRLKFPGTSGGRRTLFDGAVHTCMHAASVAACDHSRPDRVLPVIIACSGQLCSCTYLRHGRVTLHKQQLRIKRLGQMAVALGVPTAAVGTC